MRGVNYIVIPEYISCVLMALIGVYMLFDKKASSPKETAFRISLVFSILAIVNNIISIHAIEYAAQIPVLFNVCFNTLYYFFVACLTTMISVTTYITMFEGRYDEPRLKKAIVSLALRFFHRSCNRCDQSVHGMAFLF